MIPGPFRSVRVRAVLAEPHDDSREMYGEWLPFDGVDVVDAVRTPREAFADLCAIPADVLIVAVRGSCEVDDVGVRSLTARAHHLAIPTIALTITPSHADRAALERAGFDVVLVKPCLGHDIAEQALRLVSGMRERLSSQLRDRN